MLLSLTMRRTHAAGGAKLLELKALWIILLVLRGGIVAAFAGCASQRYHNAILFAFTSHFSLRSCIRAWLAVT
jgi:hypothetical protein